MSPCRILVVDDHDATQQLVRELLEADGHRLVVGAGNAKEAYRSYLTYRPDIVVMDLMLPGEGGLDIAAQILEFDEEAVAAATFRQETGPLPAKGEPDLLLSLSLQSTALAGGGKGTALKGGAPIVIDGEVAGAVGVGGGTGEQDQQCADAGAAALL